MQNNFESLIKSFREPSGEYTPLLMWFWNDVITEEQITFQMEKMREQRIFNFFIHPACGCNVEYLSDRYMELIQHVVREAKRLGMYYWIYDEYEFPSGTAGGMLIQQYPQYRKKIMRVYDRTLGGPGDLVRLTSDGEFIGAQMITEKHGKNYVRDVSDQCVLTRQGELTQLDFFYRECNASARLLFYFCEVDRTPHPSGANRVGVDRILGYVDTLNYDAITKYIEMTHERYKQFIGEEFGKTVRGVFTDEPIPHYCYHYTSVGAWSDTFDAEFEKDHGYSLRPWLYTLWNIEAKSPEEIRAQSDYRHTIKRLFLRNFSDQVNDWCKANDLYFTGHYNGEEDLMNHLSIGDLLDALMRMGVPGIDAIYCQNLINTQEFNVAGKVVSSAAKFSGANRTLCETYTGSGWRLRFPTMKRIANRLLMLGVNWIQYMGGFYSTGGSAKNFPFGFAPSHNYQNTLFAHYHELNNYIGGFQALSAATRPDSKVLLMIPLQQTIRDRHHWINGQWDAPDAFASFYDLFFINTVNALLKEGVGYDMFSENMTDKITVHDGWVEAFGYRYDTFIFPRMYYVNSQTRALIEKLRANHVKMIFTHELPTVDTGTGEPFALGFDAEQDLQADAEAYFILPHGEYDLDAHRSALRAVIGERILNLQADEGIYLTQRSNADAQVWFLCNDSEAAACAEIDALPGMQVLTANSEAPVACTVENGRMKLRLDGWQMVAIVRDMQGSELPVSTEAPAWSKSTTVLDAPYEFTTVEGNVLPLDYEMFDPETGIWEPCPFMYFAENVHLRPEEPYKLRAKFVIETMPEAVELKAEVWNVTKLTVNGTDLEYCVNDKRGSPFDYTVDATAMLHVGENCIEVEGIARNFSMFIRPPYLYLSGDFGVDAEKRMVEPVHRIANVGWEQIGYPWFSGDGVFKTSFSVEDGFEKVVLTVPTRDIASVWVNGQFVGKRLWLAEEVDITTAVRPGENALEVRVTSTRANMYGCETASRFGSGAIYAAYAGERTENGILAPMEVHTYK